MPHGRFSLSAALHGAAVALALVAAGAAAQELSFDNLQRVKDAKVAAAYIDPEADFSVFRRVQILEPYVAFQADWQRRQNQPRAGTRVTARDMERIREAASALLKDVFIEALEQGDGYQVVDEVGDDVLILRPALIDLNVAAPDATSAGRNYSVTASAGAATLYLELFDGASGKIIGRAADRRVASRPGSMMMWSNRVTNTSDARRMFRIWANQLREFLDSHYMGKS